MIYSFNISHFPALSEVGGKAQSLIRMRQARLPVPPGFVLTVDFFRPWLTELQATPQWEALQAALDQETELAPVTDALKAVCAGLPFTPEQKDALSGALAALPEGALLAVRSSSPEEDLAGASFAGGYETSLGVRREALPDAIRASFASAFDERVFVYKQQQGFAVDQPRIAVIVQQQIAAEIAGVGFSLNPINNDYDEAVIDANWGLGESVVAGQVAPDHFVVDKVTHALVEKRLGGKETSIWLQEDGGTFERPDPRAGEFTLDEEQLTQIVAALTQIEALYEEPVDMEWAISQGQLYILQARPITAYIPLVPEMQSKPGERRTLFWDGGLTEGITTNSPMSPLTLDWIFQTGDVWVKWFVGPVSLPMDADPFQSLMFGAGGRYYFNASQLLTLMTPKQMATGLESVDVLLYELLLSIDRERYRAAKKIPALGWGSLLRRMFSALWCSRRLIKQTILALWRPKRFYHRYEQIIDETVRAWQQGFDPNLSFSEIVRTSNERLAAVVGELSFPALIAYFYHLWRLSKIFSGVSEEVQAQVDALKMGFGSDEAVDIGLQLYRMSQLLTPVDFADLDRLAERVRQRDLPADFLAAWDAFVTKYGVRGPEELELSNPRYGDDPKLALEQMSYMAGSDFDPVEQQARHMAERERAYGQLLQALKGRKRRQFQRTNEIITLMGNTRDTPKYLLVLVNGALRRRALLDGERFVGQGRLDAAEDIFWCTFEEIERAHADPSFDLRQVKEARQPFYNKLKKVHGFPHLIDSRGRIGRVETAQKDPHVFAGMGISRGVAVGRVKVLHSPREKPIEEGDVLVTYTTDPGWTPLFVNAEAIILEVGGMLQHGGVVAREYGKPCVVGIQGITTALQDGQLVEVDGAAGLVRILA